jgi:hypothetical protein
VNTAYTATITLTAKAGHTLNGIVENFFTVTGATSTNATNTGIISAIFPATVPIQLTISALVLTISKVYDASTTAVVTAGSLIGVVNSDVVTVTGVATYDTITVGTGKTITTVYTLAGANAGNYIKPINYSTSTGVITAAIPSAPTIGSAVAGNATATVAFTAPVSNGGSAITYYTVTSSSTGAVVTATSTASPIEMTGLTNGIAYTFSVTATNAVGTSSTSADSNEVTPVSPALYSNSTGDLTDWVETADNNGNGGMETVSGGLSIYAYTASGYDYQEYTGGYSWTDYKFTSTLKSTTGTGYSSVYKIYWYVRYNSSGGYVWIEHDNIGTAGTWTVSSSGGYLNSAITNTNTTLANDDVIRTEVTGNLPRVKLYVNDVLKLDQSAGGCTGSCPPSSGSVGYGILTSGVPGNKNSALFDNILVEQL